MTLDSRVLEELVALKEEALKTKDLLFTTMTQQALIKLRLIETMLQEDSFFPAQVLNEVRELKQLIKISQ